MQNFRITFFLIALAFLTSCTCRTDKIIQRVGRFTITEDNIHQKNEIIRINSPQETRDIGKAQLSNELKLAVILESYGHQISNEALYAEAERIEKTTLTPNNLIKIQNLFGTDKESYLKVFIMPLYAEKLLITEVFPRRTKSHNKLDFESWLNAEKQRLNLQ